MATLIQSKQIEGVVTASVIQGDFLVSGSLVVTGSGIFTSDITASSISSSGPIYGVRYSDVQGTPNFVAGSGIVITQVGTTITITNTGGGGGVSGSAELISSVAQLNSYTGSNDIIILGLEQFTASIQSELDSLETRVSALESQTDNTGSDSQTLSIVGDQLTISGGNTITIPSGGGGTSDFTELTNVPSGLVSSSDQILGGTGILSGSHTDISALNDFTSSSDSRLSSLESATASLQSQIDGIVHTQIPEGTISSSQQILDLGFVTSSETVDLTQINQATQSLQDQIDRLTAVTSSFTSGEHTDISSLNTFTSSVESRLDILESSIITGSMNYIQVLGNKITNITSIGASIISGSITTSGNPVQVMVTGDANPVATGWTRLQLYRGETPIGNIIQVENEQNQNVPYCLNIIDTPPAGTHTYSMRLVSGISGQFEFGEAAGPLLTAVELNSNTQLPSGLISGSSQLTSSLDERYSLSGSDVDISALNAYTASNDETITELQTRIDVLSAATSSYITSETDSQLLTIVGDQLSISNGNTITIPTGSGGGVSSWNDLTDIPSGIVSSSDQIVDDLDVRYVSSTDFADYAFSTGDKLSGLDFFTESIDSRVTALEDASSSHVDISSLNDFTSSIQSQVDALSAQTSSYLTELPSGVFSGSILPGTNITIDSSSGDYIISASLVGGGDTSFDGDRIISNTLLGDLYSSSFNAGTSGSIQDFLEAIFFPTYAPTATFVTQTSNLNTNVTADGTVIETISISDTVDDSPYVVTISGDSSDAFRLVPTNADSSSWEIQSVDNLLAGTFTYNITVTDKNGASRTYTNRSIEILQASTGTLSTNGTFYVIESATTGPIYLGSNGRSGTQGSVSVSYTPNYGSQVATNFSSSNSLISVNSTTGVLSVGSPISGSGNIYPNTITSTISWEDQYGNTDSDSITVNIARNYAPTVVSAVTSNTNTNQATGSAQIIRLTATDTEGDSIPNSGLVWTSYNTTYFSASVSSPYMYLHANNTSIPAGIYSISYSTTDVHGFRTTYGSTNVNIQQATAGTLGGDINNYIIESAVIGDDFQDATGYGNGNQSQVVVSYTTNYGSQVPTFTSSNPAVVIDSDGYLNLGVDLSGSVTQSGDTFTSTITWEDQYGNSDSRTINVTVFGNQSPSVSFTDLGLNTDTAVSGSHIGTLTISDTEGNTPFSASIGGTDGGKFEIVPQNANSSSYYVYPTGSLVQGDYSVQFVVTDNYSETATLNETISVSSATDYGTIYVYTQNLGPAGAWSTAQYKGIYGISGESGDTPPEVTSFTTATSMLSTLVNNDVIGDSTITFASTYTMTLRDTISGDTTLDSALASNGNISFAGTANILLLYPSGSDMEVPTSIQETINGTAGGAVPYLNADGGGWGVAGAKLNSITLGTPHLGYSEWFVLGRLGTDGVGSSFEYRLINANGGSAPS